MPILNNLWGLIPNWSKDRPVGAKLNNARGETVHEKPSFRRAFKKFRCLIPACGYYQWQTPAEDHHGLKQPFYIYPSQSPYLALAGICDHWTDESTGELVMSTAIVTTEPCEKLKGIHDHMPVLLPERDWATWLDTKNQDVPSLRQFISSNSEVSFHPVGFGVSGVGKIHVDTASLIEPIMNELR
ncbi:SOS response-associated peptidase [Limnobacter sp.]|uniref:SOS response-associated peptidase n=1 Tax=Limnobacter sp. TaxID=2003368 RepID=UPI002583FB98|nr:SOS response-associated peptidase [Limnobacter sp.]